MTSEIIFREYIPGDENQIVELLQNVFGGWPHFDLNCKPIDHWKWKYLENPSKSNTILLAEDSGKIVGCDCGFFLNIKVGNNILFAQQGTDSAIAPAYQGGGLYSKLNNLKYALPQMKKLDFSYWASSNRKLITWAKKRGLPMFPRHISKMIRIKDLDLHFRHNKIDGTLLKRLGYVILKDLNIKTVLNKTSISYDYEIKDIKLFENNIESFWESLINYYKYIIVRNREYLNWRYCDPRGGNYYIKQAEANGIVVGYCVYRVNKFDAEYYKGDITDLLTFPGRVDVAFSLLNSVLENLDNLGLNYVSCWSVQGHYLRRILESFSFVNGREALQLYYKPLGNRFNYSEFDVARPNELHFQISDIDW